MRQHPSQGKAVVQSRAAELAAMLSAIALWSLAVGLLATVPHQPAAQPTDIVRAR
jgi:hypothetical protein